MSPTISVKDLTKTYGSFTALDRLNLELAPGEVVGYLGPNGAGKTTTIRLLLSLIAPTRGKIEIFGLDATKHSEAIHRRLAYVPGDPNLWPGLTGEETLHLLGNLHGSVDHAYQKELIDRFAFDPRKKVRQYSKGNRQKLSLIAAFMTRAELLILDEPTSGLDPLMEQVFQACIHEAKEHQQTVLLSSHILSEVEALCDRVAMLRGGKLVEVGTMEQIRRLATLSVEIEIIGKLPNLSNVEGLTDLHAKGQHLDCQIHGSIQPLLKALEGVEVGKLLSHEPSLDELFLSLYGAPEADNQHVL